MYAKRRRLNTALSLVDVGRESANFLNEKYVFNLINFF
jgi:hypothetical protein